MSGRLAAGWARRGHAALPLEVSAGKRTRARLPRRRPACVHASCVQTPLSARPRGAERTSRAEAGWFEMICAGIFAATEPHSEQQRWMDAGKGVERRG